MSRLRNDVISGLVLLVFALSLHLIIIPAQVASHGEGPVALSPRLFCHITAFLLLVLSLALVISGLRDQRPQQRAGRSEFAYKVSRGGSAILLSVLYILAMEPLGYFVSTTGFMALFLWFSGVRSWKGGLVFLAVILPFIYLLFVKALKVILPSGLLI